MILRGKEGQVTIFVIIALVIVVSIVAILYLFPDLLGDIGISQPQLSPAVFMRTCVSEDLDPSVEKLSKQGGYANQKGSVLHNGFPVKYLCYNAQYFRPCLVQQPLIKANFEKELEGLINDKSNECLRDLKEEFESRGYTVNLPSNADTEIDIEPGKMLIKIKAPVTVTKDTTEGFNEFNFVRNTEIYDLLMISTSIIDYESTYGDTETALYMAYYPNLRIRKKILTEGTTIYTVEDVTTNEEFTFASRGLAWPGGYGLTA